MLQYELLVIR